MRPGDSSVRADPSVVRGWVTGWTLARGTPLPIPEFGGFRVDVGWPEQKVRYVFPRCTGELRRLAETICDPFIFLKVCAPPEVMRAFLTPRWEIQPIGFMMVCSRPMRESALTLPPGYALNVAGDIPVAVAKILTQDRDVATIGRVALTEHFAIYDRIETRAGNRRRGFGRAVMKALEAVARARGNTFGVLVATAEGRPFYEALGWHIHSLYTTAVIPP